MMINLHTIVLIILFFAYTKTACGQTETSRLTFIDSVYHMLQVTQTHEATAISSSLNTVWTTLSPEQQTHIRDQVTQMTKKRYPISPHILNYYKIIVSLTSSPTHSTHFTEWLSVAHQVINQNDVNKTKLFFQNSRQFINHQILFQSSALQVIAESSSFHFSFNEPPPALSWESYYESESTPNKESSDIAFPSGPVIEFDDLSLTFATILDSAYLTDTKGVFSLTSRNFYGQGGHFDWSVIGLPPKDIFYTFKSFTYNASSSSIDAKEGSLTYPKKLKNPIPGSFKYACLPAHRKAKNYPTFISSQHCELSGLPPSVSLIGGISLYGKKIKIRSIDRKPVVLKWDEGAKNHFKVTSYLCALTDSTFQMDKARLVIHHDADSILHPSVWVVYDLAKSQLTATRTRNSTGKSPFVSSLFKFDFNADKIVWDTSQDHIQASMMGGSSSSPLVFESNRYFHPDDYRTLQGKGFQFHPILLVARFVERTGKNRFYINEIIPDSKSNYSTVVMAMQFLSEKGMIEYNPADGSIYVREKALLWSKASRGKSDYDEYKIQAYTPAQAKINISDNKIDVYGVETFQINDSIQIRVDPDSSRLKLFPHRGVAFNGKLETRSFDMHGKDFTIDYNTSSIEMSQIDSLQMYQTQNGRRQRMKNAMISADTEKQTDSLTSLSPTQGKLYLKGSSSTTNQTTSYPLLEIKGSEVVFFDQPYILNKAYDRSVFFSVSPFKMDSLGRQKKDDLQFSGTFVSGDILPDFSDQLQMMSDQVLGFHHTIPTGGYSLYQGRGKLFGELSMNTQGLRAKGHVKYIHTRLNSDDFILYTDSVVAKGSSASIQETATSISSLPNMTVEKFKVQWLPYTDSMKLYNLKSESPFQLYNKRGTLDGQITVSKNTALGKGLLQIDRSEIISDQIHLSASAFEAHRVTVFKLPSTVDKQPAVLCENVKLNFDLQRNWAQIHTQDPTDPTVEFPYVQFKTSAPRVDWDMNQQKVIIDNQPIDGLSHWYSTREEMEQLNFSAEQAVYDIQKQELTIRGVPYINIADAQITPNHGELIIGKNAQIRPLKKAIIVMDTIHQYHVLTQATVKILSKNLFAGSGIYQYVNASGDTTEITMGAFQSVPIKKRGSSGADLGKQTSAHASIQEHNPLHIAPKLLFKGDITMLASYPKLILSGYVSPSLNSSSPTWIKYNHSGDEEEIRIDFDNAITINGNKPNAGLFYNSDGDLYPIFLTQKKASDDDPFFLPSGELYYDHIDSVFRIENPLKATGEMLTGHIFSFDDKHTQVHFEGAVNFLPEIKGFSLTSAGLGDFRFDTQTMTLNSFILFDTNIPQKALHHMAHTLAHSIKVSDIPPGLGDHTQLIYKMAGLLDEKTVTDYETASLRRETPLTMIPQLITSLAVSNVNLKWSKQHKSLYSDGLIGISHMNHTNINGGFEGFLEIHRSLMKGITCTLFFKVPQNAWYYFGLHDNFLSVYSSDEDFNAIFSKGLGKQTVSSNEVSMNLGHEDEVIDFIHQFRKNYYDLESPYNLSVYDNSYSRKKKSKKEDDDGF